MTGDEVDGGRTDRAGDPFRDVEADGGRTDPESAPTDDDEAGDGRGGEVDATGGDDGGDAAAPPVLELRSATREYHTGGEVVRALVDVDFAVDRGESVAVVGPSGSGKSTMLNLLGLLDAPTEGTVLLDGEDATDLPDRERTEARKAFLGFVFQDFFLIPTLSARENVEVPTMFDRQDRSERAVELLERVGLGDRLDHYPSELSGGQKQRVAIARALVNRPDVVLADEPTGNLDRDTGKRILAEFERVRAEGVGVVFVTHDPLVTDYAERTVELVDGRIGAGDGGIDT